MTEVKHDQDIWIAANYHMPSTYSIRVPMSSMSSSLILPAPGPATIRLALIRTGIELLGYENTRDVLFPVIRSAEIRIKPPARIGISTQYLRAYKASSGSEVVESIIYRETACSEGNLTVYLRVPPAHKRMIYTTLAGIGYWGQANSFTYCLDVTEKAPVDGECSLALQDLQKPLPLQNLFTCFVTEFAHKQVEWESVLPEGDTDNTNFLRTTLFLWPLLIEQRGRNKLLLWRSLETGEKNL